jgi:hypothetical protein
MIFGRVPKRDISERLDLQHPLTSAVLTLDEAEIQERMLESSICGAFESRLPVLKLT